MYPLTLLEWFHVGRWQRIGWDASSPQSAEDLRVHGQVLADYNSGRYRLVTLTAEGEVTVVHEYTPRTTHRRRA